MTDDKKKALFPYFAYIYSQELNPEKYGQASSLEEWSSLIQDSKDDIDSITNAAEQLTDDEWDVLDQQYTDQVGATQETQKQYIKKGAKLKELKMGTKEIVKKNAKPEMKKKCGCGCEVITKKFKGGQLVDTCGCCGKDHSKFLPETLKTGGKVKIEKKIVKKQVGGDSTSASSQVGVAKCGGKVKDRIKKSQEGSKLKYDVKKPYSKTNFDGNTYNKNLEGLKKSSIDSLQTYNKSNTNESDQRNAKQVLSDLRTGKSKMPKKEKGGKTPSKTFQFNKEENKNTNSKPNRIGKAKIDSAKCGKKLKPKIK